MTGAGLFVGLDQVKVLSEKVGLEFRDNIRIPPDLSLVRRMYFDPPTEDAPGPQAFLVEMPGPCTNMAHFHEIDQFQLFFGGNSSWYKRHALPPLTVHYSDAYSTYGPFGSSSEETFRFLTLRPVRSVVAGYMPWARKMLERQGRLTHRRRRNFSVELTLDTSVSDGGSVERTVIEPEADGLAAKAISLAPGVSFDGPARDERSAGRYYYVARGSIENEGTVVGAGSVGWLGSDDLVPVLTAASGGCDLVVLDFPSQRNPSAEPPTG